MTDPIDENLVELHAAPMWRQAAGKFMDHGYVDGEPVPHAWFYEAFGIEMPTATTPMQEADRMKLQYLGAMEKMREFLLAEHQVCLRSVRGVGYAIVPPDEQTAWAEEDSMTDMKKVLSKARDRLTNVDTAKLSADQRLENANALARLSMMAGLHQKLVKGDLNPLITLPKTGSGKDD